MLKIFNIFKFKNTARSNKLITSLISIVLIIIIVSFTFLKPRLALADSTLGFDEGYGTTVSDGNGNISGTITNALWRTDELCFDGKCLYFDGSGDYVSFGDDSDLDKAASDNFTLEGWFRTPDITSGTRVLVAKYNSATGTDGGYKVYMDSNGYLIFGIDDDQTSFPEDSVSTTTTSFDDNKWHHFAAVKTGTTSITIYVDGKQYETDSSISSTGTLANTDGFYIGIDGDGSSNGFSGFLDQFKFYNTARSVSEVNTDITGQTTTKGVSAIFGSGQSSLSNGLVGYWKLDETSWTGDCSTASVVDSSGNSFNAKACPNASAPSPATGRFANGGTFDGIDDYVAANDVVPSIAGIGHTISFWMKSSTCATQSMIAINTSGGGNTYQININGSCKLVFFTTNEGSQASTTSIANGNWHNIVLVIDDVNDKVTTYIDGVLEQSNLTMTATVGGTNVFSMGQEFDAGPTASDFYNGQLDEVRVYNRLFTQIEAASLAKWGPGPVGWWKLDENRGTSSAYDSSGNNNTMSFNGSIPVSAWLAGKFGSALRFDGLNDYLSATDNGLYEGNDFTLEAWVNLDTLPSVTAESCTIFVKAHPTSPWYSYLWTIDTSNKSLISWNNTGATEYYSGGTTALTVGKWYHLAVVKNGTAFKQYLNGADNTSYSDTTTGTTYNSSGSLWIGAQGAGVQGRCKAVIDEAKMYNYPRTSAQIVEDLNGGHPSPGSPVGSAVADWGLDEGYSTTAHDASLNALDLALSTASWTNSGKFGKAWDGTAANWMSISDAATAGKLDFAASDDFSISLWFKTNSSTNPSVVEYLLSKSESSAGYRISNISDSSGYLRFGVDDDTSWTPDDSVTTQTDVYDQNWHHLVVTKLGTSKLQLYLDGLLKSEDTSILATGTLANSITFYLGDRNGADGGDEFDGDLDNVRIYRSVLNADQVKAEYNQGQSTVMGAVSTNSSGAASWSANDEYCPPGQGSTCTSPVGEWKFDENTGTAANDSSSKNYNGTVTNPNWSSGKYGSALKFANNGTQEVVTVADNSDLDVTGSDDFTISAWVRASENADSPTIVRKMQDYSGTTPGYHLDISDSGGSNAVYCEIADNTGTHSDSANSSSSNIEDGKWHYVTCILDRNGSELGTPGLFLIIDGQTVGFDTSIASTGTLANSESLYIGEYNTVDMEYNNGFIDNVRFFKYARSSPQIAWDYNRGAPTAWWQLDENTGTLANDATGNTTAGTLTGPTWVTGKINYGLNFNTADGRVVIPDVSGTYNPIDFGIGPFSISMWVKHATSTTQEYALMKWLGDEAEGGYAINIQGAGDGRARFGTDDDGSSFPEDSALSVTPVDDDNWHHVVGVRDAVGGELRIYVDGKLEGTDSIISATGSVTNNDNLYFGTRNSLASDWVGSIDDVRIFNYVLTLQQIKAIMNDGSAVKFNQ